MRKLLHVIVITGLLMSPCAYTAQASTASMLVERPVTQFPDAPKGLISIDDSMWLQALKAVLASDLEPRQKSDLADKLIGQQFESKSGFWKGLFETSIKLISLAAGIFTAIKVAS